MESGSLAFGLLHLLLSVHLSSFIPLHAPFGYSIAATLVRFAQWKLAIHKLALIYFQLKQPSLSVLKNVFQKQSIGGKGHFIVIPPYFYRGCLDH